MQFCLGALDNVLYVFCFAEVCLVFKILRMQKNLYLLSRQHVTAKTVISLKIQENIDLSQRVTLKNVDLRLKPLKFDFMVTCDRKDINFTQITAKC